MNTFIVRTLERGTSSDRSQGPRWATACAGTARPEGRSGHGEDIRDTGGRAPLRGEPGRPGGVTAAETAERRSSRSRRDTPGAEELVERAAVECRPSGTVTIVVVKVRTCSGMRLLRRNAVTVRVEVPEGSEVEVATASADVEINGPVGDGDVHDGERRHLDRRRRRRRGGQVGQRQHHLGAVGGDLRAHTASGDLRCSSVAGRPVFATASGDLEVGAAAERGRGEGDVGRRPPGRAGPRAPGSINVSGDVRVLVLGEGTLHVRSVSGDVLVGVAKGVDLHVDVETCRAWYTRTSRSTTRPRRGHARHPGGPQRAQRLGQRRRSGGRSSRWPDRSRSRSWSDAPRA